MQTAAHDTSSTIDKSLTKLPRLTQAEVEHYRREGYVTFKRPVLEESRFQALKSQFETLLSKLDTNVRPEDMDMPHMAHPELFQWLLDDAVLDLVEPLIGPDIALFSSHFICKPPGKGRRVPWHKDSDYWHGRMEPQEIATVWLALDASTAENGALKVVPGTHHTHAASEYEPVDREINVFADEIKRRTLDVDRAVTLELEPNQASLHHARLAHGSDANTSNLRRCGYTMRYFSTRNRLVDGDRNANHMIFLARGKDHAGNRYAEAGKDYSELLKHRRGPRGH